MSLDVRADHLQIIKAILDHHIPEYEVFAFGSRATGKARNTSDLDLCIRGENPLGLGKLSDLKDAFSESNIPYKVDVVEWVKLPESFQKSIQENHILLT
jgi:predicted nucleotidyltransferase